MSILIKGMEMPPRCGRCDMRIPAFDDGTFDHYECCITAAIIDNLGEKMEDCPLVPVPPHGRLIDAAALMGVIRAHDYPLKAHFNSTDNGMFTIGIQQAVDEAPTIIPADHEEEEMK